MLWNFQSFMLKCNNSEWWQQKQTDLPNNVNRTFVLLIGLFQKQANKPNSENWLEV